MANSFTGKTSWFWQNVEKLLIILLLATFTLNIRKVFLTPYSFLNGTFNEYLTISFSWADLLMLAVIIIYTIKSFASQFVNHASGKSLFDIVIRFLSNVLHRNTDLLRRLQNVSRETFILLALVTWTGLSIFWSQYKPIAIYRFAVILEIIIFALIAIKSLKSQKWLSMAVLALIANDLFQSILGITQFVHNKSLGIHWLGESILGPNIDGVAKIVIEGEKHIRAYGTLPHPNILAGFLIIPIFLILAVLFERLSIAEKSNEPLTTTPHHYHRNCNFAENSKYIPYKLSNWLVEVRGREVSRGTFLGIFPTWLVSIIFLIIASGFILTFSRSAFLGSAVGFLVLYFLHREKLARQSRLALVIIFFSAALAGGYLAYLNRDTISFFSSQSLQERNLYQNVARETISAHPLAGVGIGQFVFEELKKNPKLEGWQLQPVHNVYLLVFSELGIAGLIFFLLWIFSILEWGSGEHRNTDLLRLTNNVFYCIVLSYFFILLFDHYFWDIKLGLVILILPITFLKISENRENL